ncbi:exported hypothetical protein [uncultured Defluviicoccus sp.]|uniref:Uncharacterized protein n=1 Tax=metagenome TaxID=256318 RepID=A0A380TE63_9ZZZZ|nr:exported hypothetical protein [uncultured Defluviicoccus sp.]
MLSTSAWKMSRIACLPSPLFVSSHPQQNASALEPSGAMVKAQPGALFRALSDPQAGALRRCKHQPACGVLFYLL